MEVARLNVVATGWKYTTSPLLSGHEFCVTDLAATLEMEQSTISHQLRDMRAQFGLSLLFISHDLSVIRRLCQGTFVLFRGEIVENRPTADLFTVSQAAYTRELLDAIPLPDPTQVWS